MSDIVRKVDGITVTRHGVGNWSIGDPGHAQLHKLHALKVAHTLEVHLGVPKDDARQVVADIMIEARRSPALV
jgi:hypothetical protein